MGFGGQEDLGTVKKQTECPNSHEPNVSGEGINMDFLSSLFWKDNLRSTRVLAFAGSVAHI